MINKSSNKVIRGNAKDFKLPLQFKKIDTNHLVNHWKTFSKRLRELGVERCKVWKFPFDKRTYCTDTGVVFSDKPSGLLIRGAICKHSGYVMTPILLDKDNGIKVNRVQEIIFATLTGVLPPAGLNICHNSGDKADNSLANLRLDTPAGNNHDKRSHGTNGKLGTPEMARLVYELQALGVAPRYIKHYFEQNYNINLSYANISHIRCGVVWRSIFNLPAREVKRIRYQALQIASAYIPAVTVAPRKRKTSTAVDYQQKRLGA